MSLISLFCIVNILLFAGLVSYAFITARKTLRENGKTLSFEFRVFRWMALHRGTVTFILLCLLAIGLVCVSRY